jgi:2-keto-4-pentenoate hydratase/2-oxohepta-3-ene-1,7-dioic acid hydratase in catechol pathway
MKICRFNDNRVGVVENGIVKDVTEVASAIPAVNWPLPRGDMFIERLGALCEEIEKCATNARSYPLEEVRLLSPIANPGKIVAAPVNYKLHLEESQADQGINFGSQVKTIEECGVFLKATSSVIGADAEVEVTREERRTDHEIELAFVIGKRARNVSENDALDYVAGYMIGLDITIRGTEDRSYRKSLDTFTVLGPWLVTADEFGDPADVEFELKVNGQTRQKSNTRNLIYGVRKLISYASHAYTLEPGDVFLTGTPEGVASIHPGDIMDCLIDRVGSMQVKVSGARFAR